MRSHHPAEPGIRRGHALGGIAYGVLAVLNPIAGVMLNNGVALVAALNSLRSPNGRPEPRSRKRSKSRRPNDQITTGREFMSILDKVSRKSTKEGNLSQSVGWKSRFGRKAPAEQAKAAVNPSIGTIVSQRRGDRYARPVRDQALGQGPAAHPYPAARCRRDLSRASPVRDQGDRRRLSCPREPQSQVAGHRV